MNKVALLSLSILSCALSMTASAAGIWGTVQGNSAHTGYVNVKSDPAKLHVIWSKQVYVNNQTLSNSVMQGDGLVADDKMAYVDISYGYLVPAEKVKMAGERWLLALNPQTGDEVWKLKRDPTWGYSSIAYDNHKILSYRRIGDSLGVDVVRPDTGQIELTIPVADSGYQSDGLLVDEGKIYPSFNPRNMARLYKLDASTGKIDWISPLKADSDSNEIPVATPQYIVYGEFNGISVYDKQTGKFKFEMTDNNFYKANGIMYRDPAPVYDAVNNVVYECFRYAPYGERVVAAFDLTTKKIKWISAKNTGYGFPALAGNEIFVTGLDAQDRNVTILQSIDTASGKVNWTWQESAGLAWTEFPVVTDDLIFINGHGKIYAISRHTHQKVWEFEGGGTLALGNHILYILQETTRKIPDSEYSVRNGLKITAVGF